MSELVAAFGLALALEGLLLAAFPGFVRRRMTEILAMDGGWMRTAGIAAAVCGVGVVAVARLVMG